MVWPLWSVCGCREVEEGVVADYRWCLDNGGTGRWHGWRCLVLRGGASCLHHINLGLTNLEIEGDNICVVKALKKEWTTPWEIYGILMDTREDLKSVNVVQIRHCFREVNMAADFQAKKGVNCTSREDWRLHLPTSLNNICRRDLL